jgi:hypothetical protein
MGLTPAIPEMWEIKGICAENIASMNKWVARALIAVLQH